MAAQKKVIVIGGGVAGISAAHFLVSSGHFNVRLLEASSRLGGRVCSSKLGDYWIERGAQFCHGETGNAVFELAHPLGFLNVDAKLIKVQTDTNLSTFCIVRFQPESVFITQRGEILGPEIFDKLSKVVSKIIDGPEEDSSEFPGDSSFGNWAQTTFWRENSEAPLHPNRNICSAILDWISRYQNNIDGADNWFQPSCRGQEEYQCCEGNSTIAWKPPARYSTLLNLILNQPPENELEIPSWVELNKEVQKINYDPIKGSANVSCKDGSSYEADHVICTISLGCLRACHNTLFNPPLDSEKIKTIFSLGFGAVNKIHLEFDEPFWPKDSLGYNLLWEDNEDYSFIYEIEDFQKLKEIDEKTNLPLWTRGILGFYTVISHPKALLAWITGPSARCIETLTSEEVEQSCRSVLEHFLTPTGLSVTQIIASDKSNWFSNEFTRGSYSYRSVESEKADIWAEKLAEPILGSKDQIPLICFAGEATHSQYYSTVHGARDTGLREAKRLINAHK